MLGCTKTGMTKNDELDEQKHKEYFGTLSYSKVYRIGKINVEKKDVDFNPLSLDDLMNVSIIAPKEEIEQHLKRKQECTDEEVGTKKMKSTNDSDNFSDTDVDEILMYLDKTLPMYNLVGPSRGTCNLKSISDDCRSVELPVQDCPFIKRKHKRSEERGVSSHYILFTSFDVSFRCWKCSQDCIMLPLIQGDFLEKLQQSSNYLLKNALYKQTHETIADYVFSLVKGNISVSLSGSHYTWYFYDNHRWFKGEKIIAMIMNTKGVVQTRYSHFINQYCNNAPKGRSDRVDTEDEGKEDGDARILKELWKKLQISLQTTQFVKNGILPLLATKLEEYWNNIGSNECFKSKLDSNPQLLCFKNGVFDLQKNEFRDGTSLDFLSMSTNNKYIPWDKINVTIKEELMTFLQTIFVNEKHLSFILQQFALSLNGQNKFQSFFILTGAGANGKSTLIRLLNYSLGDYAGEVNVTLFTHPRPSANAPSPELIQIMGKRFVVCSEPNSRETFNLGTVKWLTGGDRITAAAKFEANQSFYLQCTFFLLTNDIPQINASQSDYGTWRRMKPITFNSRFVNQENSTMSTRDNVFIADGSLVEKLPTWHEAFISLLVHTSIQLSTGIQDKMPDEFTRLWKQLQNKNDLYSRFVQEYITVSSDSFKESGNVFVVFLSWIKSLRLSKNITYDIFEKHMLYILGDFIINEYGHKGWNIDLKQVPFNLHY